MGTVADVEECEDAGPEVCHHERCHVQTERVATCEAAYDEVQVDEDHKGTVTNVQRDGTQKEIDDLPS